MSYYQQNKKTYVPSFVALLLATLSTAEQMIENEKLAYIGDFEGLIL